MVSHHSANRIYIWAFYNSTINEYSVSSINNTSSTKVWNAHITPQLSIIV
uniref:Uncharacterized protein n=1 Tax=Arion vulgaris TaxID=1028688 RepID=A0A0B7BJW0_9EUPU